MLRTPDKCEGAGEFFPDCPTAMATALFL